MNKVKIYHKDGKWYCTDGKITSMGKESPEIAFGNYRISVWQAKRIEANRKIRLDDLDRAAWADKNSHRFKDWSTAWRLHHEYK